jgi:E3 ubiquitin-protein ligase mind-bomb
LHEAIVKEDPAVLNLLCTYPNTDFSISNCRGFDCLHYASLKGNLLAVQLIVSKARNLVDAKKEDGFTALLLASLNGHSDCVKVILEDGQAAPDQVSTLYTFSLLLMKWPYKLDHR